VFRAALCLLTLCAPVCAETISAPGEIRGAAVRGRFLYTWGDHLARWQLTRLRAEVLATASFGEGGCLTDLNGDRQTEFVGYEGPGLGRLTYRRPPAWHAETIDTQIEMHDCREVTLFGRRGILMVNRGMQVRFYERPPRPAQHWPYREIYSFYTASYQGDLVLHDVDRDGLDDILCGNYWIKSPPTFELPWRLFAINTHHETPEAANVRFVPMPDGRIWIFQSHAENARATLFTRPPDPKEIPKQMWNERRYGERLRLSRIHSAVRIAGDVIAAEHNGPASRLLLFRPGSEPRILLQGYDIVRIFALGNSRYLLVGPGSVRIWKRLNRRPAAVVTPPQ
jgi:hypothetical protein